MSDRVSAPAQGSARPRPSLIQYADPNSFAASPPPAPAASAASAANPHAHRRLTSDIYPVADADGGLASPGPQREFSLSMSETPMEEEEEGELPVGDEHEHDHADEHDHDADDHPPSPSGVAPSGARRAGAVLMRELEEGTEAAIAALRGKHDDGPLVEDHLLESIDYDKDEDYVNEDSMERRSMLHQKLTLLLQFLMTVAVAFVTAMVMFCVHHLVETTSDWKVETVLHLLEEGEGAAGYFEHQCKVSEDLNRMFGTGSDFEAHSDAPM